MSTSATVTITHKDSVDSRVEFLITHDAYITGGLGDFLLGLAARAHTPRGAHALLQADPVWKQVVQPIPAGYDWTDSWTDFDYWVDLDQRRVLVLVGRDRWAALTSMEDYPAQALS